MHFTRPGYVWRQSAQHLERARAYRLSTERVRQELLEPFFRPGVFKEKLFENPLICDFEGLKGRVLSNGPALEPGDPHYADTLEALEELFRAHQDNGTVRIEHDTQLVYGWLPLD